MRHPSDAFNQVPFNYNMGHHRPGTTNFAAAVTFTASPNARFVLGQVIWSYDTTPAGGRIYVQDGSTSVMGWDIVTPGVFGVDFPYPLEQSNPNRPLTVGLAAGGGGVTGELIVVYWRDRRG